MNNDSHLEKLFPGESPGKPGEICILINSIFYFVSSVLIINKNGYYRLVAKHNGKLLIDKVYNTLRGAKIAFSKLFGHRSWIEDLKAEWSLFYKPDDQWLKKRCQGTKTQK
ncbi:MAG: hypothetical protein JSV88_20900 [Candidatus Aminicenantes bacterium]|nr:MAG: hypothetical protein JSV88_20900 [Candidatus Aminicenantes bacterium]